jgi:hypothetical protein
MGSEAQEVKQFKELMNNRSEDRLRNSPRQDWVLAPPPPAVLATLVATLKLVIKSKGLATTATSGASWQPCHLDGNLERSHQV